MKTIYDNKELEEMSRAHVVVAINKINVAGGKMVLDIFLGTLMTGAATLAFVAFLVYIVSKL